MRYLYLAIHHPRPDHADDLVRAMTQFGDRLGSLPGMLQATAWHDEHSILALSIWRSRDDLAAARPAMAAAIADVPFDDWEERPRELFGLDELPGISP